MGKHGADLRLIGFFDTFAHLVEIENLRHLVDHQLQGWHTEFAGDFDRHSCSLIVLLIGPHDDGQRPTQTKGTF